MAMTERKLDMISWDAKGLIVEGRLLGIDRVKFQNGDVGLEYRIRRDDGSLAVFPGTTNINRKLMATDIGCIIGVVYEGEDESRSMSNGKNRPKLFKVMVDEDSKPRPQAQGDGPYKATDSDIPF